MHTRTRDGNDHEQIEADGALDALRRQGKLKQLTIQSASAQEFIKIQPNFKTLMVRQNSPAKRPKRQLNLKQG